MPIRFIHTSDWHIGKAFGFVEEAQTLRDERLEVIRRVGQLAQSQDARTVLVAGDVYDVQTPAEITLRQPIERMREFGDVDWHLIPGNHDPHTHRGPWERLLRLPGGLPQNIHLHLSPEAAPVAGGAAWLLPGVLTRRRADADPSESMDAMATPEGAVRLGLAHGSITAFGSDPNSTINLIAADRPARAGLAYFALGDYHGAQSRADRCWYSGTPETDDFGTGGTGGGFALVVAVEASGAPPMVTPHRTGRFQWNVIDASLFSAADIAVLASRLRALAPGDLSSALVWLCASGTLSLADLDSFEEDIVQGLGSALRVLRVDRKNLLAAPTAADLEKVDHAGFVRVAADALTARATSADDPDRELAAAALQLLYVLHMRGVGGRMQ